MTEFVGQYIVVDPRICHGKPTFKGTRILVADVLEQVASGLNWNVIVDEWRGAVSVEARREAISVARDAFLKENKAVTMENSS